MCVGVPAVVLGLSAILFAISARKDVADRRVGGASNGLAITGLTCGIIGLCLGLLYLILLGTSIINDIY